MLPSNCEYIAVLLVLSLFTVSLFFPELKNLGRLGSFWIGLTFFLGLSTTFDAMAIALGWWWFPPNKNIGVDFFYVPIEEIILFVLIYLLVVCAWEYPADDMV